MNPVNLPGERILVRDWRADEVEGRYRIFGNPEVRRFLSFDVDSMEEAADELSRIVAAQAEDHPRSDYFLAVELIATGETIGNVGFEYRIGTTPDGGDLAEVGYFFEPSSWGQGYATEAVMLIINYAFRLGATTVIAECDEENSASERLMQRCGMTPRPADEPGRLRYGLIRGAPRAS